ncbi:MAG: hypothetical protein KAT70_04750, partial [Thermoplasmata archaeon]|nr:hypothetical protein [Thermoplasmata archaeon]
PATASRYGIRDGDWVDIMSPDGRMKAVARIFVGIRPDTLIGQHGWWQGCGVRWVSRRLLLLMVGRILTA